MLCSSNVVAFVSLLHRSNGSRLTALAFDFHNFAVLGVFLAVVLLDFDLLGLEDLSDIGFILRFKAGQNGSDNLRVPLRQNSERHTELTAFIHFTGRVREKVQGHFQVK